MVGVVGLVEVCIRIISDSRKTEAGSAENRHSQMEGSVRYVGEGDV